VVTHTNFEGGLCHEKSAMFLLTYVQYEVEIGCCAHVIHNWIQIIFNNLPIEREDIVVKIY